MESSSCGSMHSASTSAPSWSLHSLSWNGRGVLPHYAAPPPIETAAPVGVSTSSPSISFAKHPAGTYRPQHHVVVLSRPSTAVPWGITLSFGMERRVLLVGKVTQPNGHVQRHSSAELVPGDCVWAVNGRPVPTLGTLSDVTSYMRQCPSLHLAVVRVVVPRPTMLAKYEDGVAMQVQTGASVRGHTTEAVPSRSWCQPPFHAYPPYPTPTPSFHCYGVPRLPYSLAPPMTLDAAWARKPVVVTPPTAPRKVTSSSLSPSSSSSPPPPPKRALVWSDPYTNPLFRDKDGKPVPYVDSWEPDDVDEGQRWKLFLAPIGPSFHDWLSRRKTSWRATWDATRPVPNLVNDRSYNDNEGALNVDRDNSDRRSSAVAIDFWSQQGYASWDQWLRASKHKWSKNYSWNRRKRKNFEIETQVSVDEDFGAWLQVRKWQWLVSRRKRLRQRQHSNEEACAAAASSPDAPKGAVSRDEGDGVSHPPTHNPDILLIDELLEEEEQRRKALEDRPPLDLSFLFEAGACPDDTVVHVLGYLEPVEYGKLLRIRRTWRQALIQRDTVWRDLCPKRWTLPRRPRKPWHEMFFTNLRREMESSQKRWDDLLAKLSKILEKGDFVQQVEKLVNEAERSFGFHINYSSGVVCERNAILNLAVIQKRHKIVRWLVEVKNADIETFDRGHFTPLLNAAWGGDKYMVRFLLQHGADRAKIGFYHYTKPLSSPDFQGRTAADWADEKGFGDVATLIRMGL